MTLVSEKNLLNDLYYMFGADITFKEIDDNRIRATVNTAISNSFLGWVFSFGGGIKIIDPVEACEKYKRMIKAVERDFE